MMLLVILTFYLMRTSFFGYTMLLEPNELCLCEIWPLNSTNAQGTPLCQTPLKNYFEGFCETTETTNL